MIKSILAASLFFVITACDNLNSSYDDEKVTPVPEKGAACTLDFQATCWKETVQKVSACLNSERVGTFSFDQRFCTNDQQMLVDFAQPQKMFAEPWEDDETPLQFRVLSDSKNECLRLSGTRNHFIVTVSRTGERVTLDRSGGVLRYTCLDGQEIRVVEKNFAGCDNREIPGLDLRPFQRPDGVSGWKFSFRGADQDPVFQCQNAF